MSLSNFKIYFLLAILIFLTACASQTTMVPVEDKSNPSSSAVDVTVESDSSQTSEIERNNDASYQSGSNDVTDTLGESQPVVLALLEQAEQQVSVGESSKAIATLERGIRIQPKDPWLWHQLGVLRLRTSEWQKAIVMAEKSISLAQGNRSLIAANWQIIATAKRSLGDEVGAREAEKNIGSISG